jgi:UDP-glucose 4-epimerase
VDRTVTIISTDASGRVAAGRALVTGAAGFIGRALTRELLARGHAVTMLDCRPSPIDHPSARQQVADIRDRHRLADIATGHDLVFHLAANTENRPGFAGGRDDLDVTVGGTVALLEALSAKPPTVTVLASTQLVYGSTGGDARELTSPLRPATLFAAAKAAAEAFLCAYAEGTGTRAVACRLANVVGPDVPRGIVADLVGQLRRSPTCLRVLGDGRQKRSFVHVDDCVSALLQVTEVPEPRFDVFNVSNRDSITVAEAARIIANCCPGPTPDIKFTHRSAWQGDATALHPDPSRLLGLGWRINHTSRDAVRIAARARLLKTPTDLNGPYDQPGRQVRDQGV